MHHAEWVRQPVTAVGRMLALCLISLTAPVRSQQWRSDAVNKAHTWTVNVEQILAGVSEDELRSNPSGSEYIPSSPLGSSPAARGPSLRSRASCEDGLTSPPLSDDSDPDSPSDQGQKRRRSQLLSSSPTPDPAACPRTKRPAPAASGKQQEEVELLDYCTQSCLLGLQTRGQLDVQCPNYERHRCSQPIQRHLIYISDLTRLLRGQFDASLDHHITPSGDADSSGVPLRVSLMPYGYTFIGKGASDDLIDQTRREAEVYQVLRSCQGSAVPVCLGTIDLQRTYFVYPGICIKHMLLLSWAGEPASRS